MEKYSGKEERGTAAVGIERGAGVGDRDGSCAPVGVSCPVEDPGTKGEAGERALSAAEGDCIVARICELDDCPRAFSVQFPAFRRWRVLARSQASVRAQGGAVSLIS